MASGEGNWINDLIHDFIHSSIWSAPIQTFIDTKCACFDYDDDNQLSSSLRIEQKTIYKRYQVLADSLITSLSDDINIDKNDLKSTYQRNSGITMDDSYEQLYSIDDFDLFTEMMKRKNLILQLQALVNLQLEHGILKPSDANDDRVLQLVLQATSASNRPTIKDNSSKVVPNLKQKEDRKVNIDRNRQTNEPKVNKESETIDSVPEDILREKLRELTISTTTSSSTNAETVASMMSSRQHFLKQQRDLIINKQRQERAQELENETINTRPQSAANVARKAMEKEQDISNDELEKRRAMAAKLRREVIDKQ
ncbi:hypothetical protein I4U23_011980 [Adineta vaga]|nr:hypothetical protein I4U23_011980 [Adineta vaga]